MAAASRTAPDLLDRYRGALLGLACGDAVGTTAEFQPRGTFEPLTDMVGGGPFRLRPGQWTDDTSMAMCLAESLVEREGFDPHDQMTRYRNWMEWGYWSATGECFDIGNATRAALEAFARTGDPWSGATHPGAGGNGSLMRLAPVVLYAHPDEASVLELAAASSRTTHAAPEPVECCRLFAQLLSRALAGAPKTRLAGVERWESAAPAVAAVAAIARGDYRRLPLDRVRGTGHCVRALEAALWCFQHTDSFRDAVLAAANLGDDADTTAAITGQIAGAYYGARGIPAGWLERLHLRDSIGALAERLHALARARAGQRT